MPHPRNRDFFSNVLNPASTDSSCGVTQSSSSPQKTTAIASSSPADGSAKKRTRSMSKAIANANDGSPEKVDEDATKPPRKVSRASTHADKKAMQPDEESMVLDS